MRRLVFQGLVATCRFVKVAVIFVVSSNSGQCAIGSTDRMPMLRVSSGLSSLGTHRLFAGNGSEHLAALSGKDLIKEEKAGRISVSANFSLVRCCTAVPLLQQMDNYTLSGLT